MQEISFILNGTPRRLVTDAQRTLLKVIREDLKLTGTKEACSTGHCGTCAVLVEGQVVLACRYPVNKARGKEITTIEGLAYGEKLRRVQESFVEHGAIQCGFCTPGFVLKAVALLEENPNPTEEEIRDYFIGNLCRCTGYAKIVDATIALSKERRGK